MWSTENGAESPVLARVSASSSSRSPPTSGSTCTTSSSGAASLRVALDTPPGSDGGITLDTLALASRLVSRELDHHDPVPGRYTLEVTSPGVERPLRTPAHFRREVGKVVAIRLSDVGHDERRVTGTLVAADDTHRHASASTGPTARSSGRVPYPRSTGPAPCSSGARREAGRAGQVAANRSARRRTS